MTLSPTPATLHRICARLGPEHREEVITLLEERCGNNLPFCENITPENAERVRYAVLKLSEGSIEKLRKMIDEACFDWRDVLVAAGFAEDVLKHRSWKPDGMA